MFRSSTADIFTGLEDGFPPGKSNSVDFSLGIGDSFYDAEGNFNHDLVMTEATSELQQTSPDLVEAANQPANLGLVNFDFTDLACDEGLNTFVTEISMNEDHMLIEQQPDVLQLASDDQNPTAIKPKVKHRARDAAYRNLLDYVDTNTGEKVTADQIREGRVAVRFKTFLQRNYRFADDDTALSRKQIRQLQYDNGAYFFGNRAVNLKNIRERNAKSSLRRTVPNYNFMIQPDADFTPTFVRFKK